MRCQPTGQPPTYTNLRDSIKVVSSGLRLKPGPPSVWYSAAVGVRTL